MDVSAFTVLFCLLLACLACLAEGRVFCYRRLKKRGKCGGLLKKINYATPEDCCRGRGVGYATRKQKVGRNRFVCTPCPGQESNTLPLPRKRDRKKNGKRRRKTMPVPKTTTSTTTTTTTTTSPAGNNHLRVTTTRKPLEWPKPQTESPNKFGYYAAFPRQDDEEKIEWSEWSPCSASCGAGWRSRFKICDGCDKNDYENVMSRPCMIKLFCSVDGNWGPWFPWQPCSQCTATCGRGVRTRTRACNSPRPLHGGKECVGKSVQTTHCSSARPCPINGGWSEWNAYGFCGAPRCDWGFRIRTRQCNNPQPQHGGAHCQGNQYERVECFNDQDCPRNGSWCPWSEWSACSSSCADETALQLRQRTCTCPEPRFGGNDCEDDSLDVRDCIGLPFCNSENEEGAGDESKSRKCRDGGLEGSGNEEGCDQEEDHGIHGSQSPEDQ